ncbi:DapH/DapD/GlmU-related protein [Cohnella faecalis]|uniref:DapH/DapD/GlmU-related protein n=1 Tax=Cohnella faecalis TaxID=2315694 RepID=UPI0018F578CA|nr:DapH/DapD/GlmU-related protein [Cohnella faecalis]
MLLTGFLRTTLEPIRFFLFQKKWRRANFHNFTVAGRRFPLDRVIVGKATYGSIIALNTNNPNSKLKIGHYCSIADGVNFLLSGEHNYKRFSTYPFKVKYKKLRIEAETKGPITVGDDVWIGQNCMILSGVTLGQGCIIGQVQL